MNEITLCVLCDQNMRDHKKVFIDGDEVFTCTWLNNDAKAAQDKIMGWIDKQNAQNMNGKTKTHISTKKKI